MYDSLQNIDNNWNSFYKLLSNYRNSYAYLLDIFSYIHIFLVSKILLMLRPDWAVLEVVKTKHMKQTKLLKMGS